LSKLGSRATHLIFIRYLCTGSYRLLKRSTGAVYSGCNVHFEKEEINLTKEPQHMEWNEEKDSLLPKRLKNEQQE